MLGFFLFKITNKQGDRAIIYVNFDFKLCNLDLSRYIYYMINQHKPDFIAEMKKALQEEKKQLENKLNSIAHKEGSDYQANFADYGRNDEDNATEIADYQATSSTEKTLEERLHSIQDALKRADSNAYGITEDGKLIPEERLRANPAATTTIN